MYASYVIHVPSQIHVQYHHNWYNHIPFHCPHQYFCACCVLHLHPAHVQTEMLHIMTRSILHMPCMCTHMSNCNTSQNICIMFEYMQHVWYHMRLQSIYTHTFSSTLSEFLRFLLAFFTSFKYAHIHLRSHECWCYHMS